MGSSWPTQPPPAVSAQRRPTTGAGLGSRGHDDLLAPCSVTRRLQVNTVLWILKTWQGLWEYHVLTHSLECFGVPEARSNRQCAPSQLPLASSSFPKETPFHRNASLCLQRRQSGVNTSHSSGPCSLRTKEVNRKVINEAVHLGSMFS